MLLIDGHTSDGPVGHSCLEHCLESRSSSPHPLAHLTHIRTFKQLWRRRFRAGLRRPTKLEHSDWAARILQEGWFQPEDTGPGGLKRGNRAPRRCDRPKAENTCTYIQGRVDPAEPLPVPSRLSAKGRGSRSGVVASDGALQPEAGGSGAAGGLGDPRSAGAGAVAPGAAAQTPALYAPPAAAAERG